MPKYYRGYILVRVKILGAEWSVVEKVKNLKSIEDDEDWYVAYCSPIYGSWDLIIEACISKLEELDNLETYLRVDDELSKMIEESITLVSTKNNYDDTKITKQNLYYRAYVMVRLRAIGSEWKITDKLKNLNATKYGEDWKVSYVSPIYGGWDLIVAISFSKLVELDSVVTYLRSDAEISNNLEETMTLVGTRQNFNG